MRKQTIPVFVSFFCLVFGLSAYKVVSMKYLKNESLRTIKPGYAGNPFNGKQFINYEDVPIPNLGKVLKWRFSKNPDKEAKKNDTWKPQVVENNTMFNKGKDKIVWLGHATFLITINGKNIITDPVFGDIPFINRLVKLPCRPEDISNIDYVLLSHGHFDHCDKKSLQLLHKQNPALKLYCPLKLGKLVQEKSGISQITEAGWYQQFNTGDDSIEFYYMPAFHWYKRSMNDENTMLWGSFVIRYKGKTIFFMGDSGYNQHFKEIGTFFPDIDICIMGVGAYKPSYMMKTSHTSPEDAVHAFHDLGGKRFVPMHYGTFDLADEPLGEPLRVLELLKHHDKINGELKVLSIGDEWGI